MVLQVRLDMKWSSLSISEFEDSEFRGLPLDLNSVSSFSSAVCLSLLIPTRRVFEFIKLVILKIILSSSGKIPEKKISEAFDPTADPDQPSVKF